MSKGLPYGWWRSLNFWAVTINGLGIGLLLILIVGLWFA